MKELLRLQGVRKYYKSGRGGLLKAVDGVSLSVAENEVFGLVGESGCGKSTLAKIILRLTESSGGNIFFDGVDIIRASGKEFAGVRKNLQIIFQDPIASLNPRKRVLDAVGEALLVNRIVKKKNIRDSVVLLLEKVGLDAGALYRYPHEFSGGQRQRICIARALAVHPRMIVADEPLSALDVSIQAQILNLLEDLQRESKLSFIFISHNLHVIEHFSDFVGVMYLGKMVEMSDVGGVFSKPLHPYTEALLSAVPRPQNGTKSKRIVLDGDVPSPLHIPSGCPFHPRCHKRFKPCDTTVPVLREAVKDRWVSCHLWNG